MPRGGPDWELYAPQKSFEQLLREGNAFGRKGYQIGAVDKHSRVQLWNPMDSGVDALIYRLDHSASETAGLDLQGGNTQFATDEGAGRNRRIQAILSDLHIRRETGLAPTLGPLAEARSISTDVKSIYPLYIWVPPGWSCDLTVRTKNVAISSIWWWFEFVSEEV